MENIYSRRMTLQIDDRKNTFSKKIDVYRIRGCIEICSNADEIMIFPLRKLIKNMIYFIL